MKRRPVSLLLLTLLLGACAQSPAPSPVSSRPAAPSPAAPSRALGLYELTFSGGGTQALTASLRPAGARGQALTSTGSVTVTPASRGDFDLGGQRYLQATFTLQNTGSSDLTNVTLLAASTSSTLSDTPISTLNRFDGSAADAGLARQVLPTQALNLDQQPQVIASKADFQAFTEADVAALAKPTGVTNVFPYGFVADVPASGSRTIPAGGSGQVTLSFKVPLQAKSSDDPFTISIMMEAVTDDTLRVTQGAEELGAAGLIRAEAQEARLRALYPGVNIVRNTVGCPVGGSGFRTPLSPLRTSGPAGAPTASVGDGHSYMALQAVSPAPYTAGAFFVPFSQQFTPTFDRPVSGDASQLAGSGSQSGPLVLRSGGGTASPSLGARRSLLAGERVQVTLTQALRGLRDNVPLCGPFVAEYRAATQPEGASGFQDSREVSTGPDAQPVAIVSSDLNGDGKADLIVGNVNSQSIAVLLSNGDGTFKPPQLYSAGYDAAMDQYYRPYSLATGDLNGDGFPDIVSGNDVNTYSVLLNKGDGTFGDPQVLQNDFAGQGVHLADVNGDGHPDLVTVNDNGGVSVLLGKGNGAFQPHLDSSSGVSGDPVITDLNEDGRLDLVTLDASQGRLDVALGNGDGTFQPAASVPLNIIGNGASIATGDVNGDGHQDVVLASGDGLFYVYLGDGHGGLSQLQDPNSPYVSQPYTAVSPQGTSSMQLGDVNGDGKLDIVTADAADNSIAVLQGQGDGTFAFGVTYATSALPHVLTLADFTGDGRLDAATSDSDTGGLSVLIKK